MKRIKIPLYAKKAAQIGLTQRKINRAGLNKAEAKKLGINSGVERAKQLIRNKYLKIKDAKRVAAFYDRFKNQKTPRARTALKLWGGAKWGRELSNKF